MGIKYVSNNSIFKVHLTNLLWRIIGFILPYIAFRILYRIGITDEAYYMLIIFSISIILLHYSISIKRFETFFKNIILGISYYIVIYILYKLFRTYKVIPEFDFLCFYLFGKVGISTSDFYNPDVFDQVFNTVNIKDRVSSDYVDEIVKVGFWYPAPSMFLFLPLGLVDLTNGYRLWQTIVIGLFLVDIYLLLKVFSSATKNFLYSSFPSFSLLVTILLFPNITISIINSQTISMFLLFLILLINYIDNWKAGVFLVILIIIKPIAAIFGLYFLFFKKWKAIASSVVSGSIILSITILFFGYEPLVNYITSPPTDRIPDFVYLETQSFLGILKRVQQINPNFFSNNVTGILYYIFGISILLITMIKLRELSRKSDALSFLVFIPLALLIYPGSMTNYNLILLPVILCIYNLNFLKNDFLNLLFILLLYFVGVYSFFLFNLILWGIIMTYPDLNKKSENIDKSYSIQVGIRHNRH